jgi:hypothetical protein
LTHRSALLSQLTRRRFAKRIAVALVCAGLSQGAELLVRADVECRLNVDGVTRGTLKTGQEVRLSLTPGEHRIEAVAGTAHWEKTLQLAALDQVIEIPLRSVISSPDYWIDPDTQMMWTAADNGSGVSLIQAIRYCRRLTLSGFDDWTLPAIDDLQRIVGDAENQKPYRIKGPIKLTGWQWSSTPGTQEGEGWALDFGDGGRASVAAGDSGLNRALCVRHPRVSLPGPSKPPVDN